MADLDFTVNADTSSAQRNLQRLEGNIEALQGSLNSLKGAIAGLALGNFIAQTVALGTQINTLSRVTDLSTDSIRGFQLALQDSGGTSQQAGDAISDLVKNIGEAALGSGELQNAFRKVGVGLEDLRTLSNQEILNKVVSGLAGIQDKSARSTIAMKIFGEAVKTVDFTNVNNGFAGFTASSSGISAASRSAAESQKNMVKVLEDLRTKLLIALDPINKVAAGILENTKAITTFIEYAAKLGLILLTFTALGAVSRTVLAIWSGLRGVFGTIVSLIKPAADVTLTWANIWKMFLGLPIVEKLKLIPLLLAELIKWVVKNLPALGALAAGWALVSDNVGNAIDKIKEYMGFKGPSAPTAEQADVRRIDNAIEAQNKKDAGAIREVQDALQKQADAIRLVTGEFKKQNNEIIDNINFEKGLVGKSEDYIEVEKAREAILRKAADETYKLRQAKLALTKDEQGLAAVYDQQIAAIAKTAQADADRIANATAGLLSLRMVEKARLQDLENGAKLVEDRNNRQISLAQQILDINQKISDVKFEGSLAGLDPLQKQILQIREENRKAALEAGRSFAAQFDGMDLTTQQSKDLANGLDGIAKKYNDLTDIQIANMMKSRTWNAGWKDAFNEYIDNATNAAMAAQNIFKVATQSMEDALVGLAKTGKFAWKDMLATMAEDLLRSQIRQLFASMMGGKSSGGSVILGALSSLGGILGFRANGGPVSAGNPYIVGERGPELVIPSSSGTVIPNSALGGGNVTYNINAVDALSFKQMIAKDPSFIHAVATQGGKSIPGTRR